MTDREFQSAISEIAKGNKDGLRVIYESYVKLIYAVVYDTVGRREEAEDITSEFFIKLVKIAPTFKKGSPHKTWLVTIAKNMAIDSIRKNSREMLIMDNGNQPESSDNQEQPRQWEDSRQATVEDRVTLTEDMRRAMKTLLPREKEVIDLKLVGQFKFKEIATMMNAPIGTVTWLYNQGIIKLRRCLANYEKQ